jgi:hypothetical protein
MEYKLILHAKIFQVFSLSVNLSMKKKKKKKKVYESKSSRLKMYRASEIK